MNKQIRSEVSKAFIRIKHHKIKISKALILLATIGLIYYYLFLSPSTKLTQEGLIDYLSRRNPPSWLVPSQSDEIVDIEQTKNYKRLKLVEFKKKASEVKLDFSQLSGNLLKEDLAAAVNTLIEIWSVTIVTIPSQDPNQDQPQKIILGEGSRPINLNDRILRWQKEIESAAEKYQLEPALLAAVIEQESGGEQGAISPVGAIGLMQLMPSTADLMGVNPYDPVQNIEGGAHYLKQQLDSFGNVQAALAAYNAGPGEVENGQWTRLPETLNYVQEVPVLIRKYERIWQENSQKT